MPSAALAVGASKTAEGVVPKGTGMPAAVAVPAIAGVASSLGAGILGSRAQSKASQASLQAQREALAYEREKEAARKAEYDQAVNLYKEQMAAYNQNRNALLGRYGIQNGPTGGRMTLGAIAGAPAPMAGPGGPPPGQEPMMQAPETDLYDWNDWSRYA